MKLGMVGDGSGEATAMAMLVLMLVLSVCRGDVQRKDGPLGSGFVDAQ